MTKQPLYFFPKLRFLRGGKNSQGVIRREEYLRADAKNDVGIAAPGVAIGEVHPSKDTNPKNPQDALHFLPRHAPCFLGSKIESLEIDGAKSHQTTELCQRHHRTADRPKQQQQTKQPNLPESYP